MQDCICQLKLLEAEEKCDKATEEVMPDLAGDSE